MNIYILRKNDLDGDTREELLVKAFSWDYSKSERHYQFYCDVEGKIVEMSYNTYIWHIAGRKTD